MTRFSPYTLVRRGALPVSALFSLVPERTWRHLAEVDQVAAEREALRAELVDALHDLVPSLDDQPRRHVLRLRRDVHNGRRPTPAVVAAAEGHLAATGRVLLHRWLDLLARGEDLVEQAGNTLAVELADGRLRLAALAGGADFLRGLQLSGDEVFKEALSFAHGAGRVPGKPSRQRRVESTLVSFACRVALKPSPFGSFTTVGAHPWRPGVDGGAGRVRSTRLNLGLLNWMAHELRGIDGAAALLTVRAANTVRRAGARVTFFTRGADGSTDVFAGEHFRALADDGIVRAVLDALAGGPLRECDLHDRLHAAGLPSADSARAVAKLVEIGLCDRDLGLPDHGRDRPATIAALLRATGTGQAVECADVFDRLAGIERDFAAADVTGRTELLAELHKQLLCFTDAVGIAPPAPEVMRAPVYEDVGTHEPSVSWAPDLLERNAEQLGLFQRVLPALDDATIERLGLYSFFTARHGVTGPDVDLLEFYAEFARLTPADASALMLGVGVSEVEHVKHLRARFAEHLRGHAAGLATQVAELDTDWLRAFADAFPAYLPPWRCAGYRMQFGDARGRLLAVVNGVTTGHGVFLSRFCDLLEPTDPDAWRVTAAIRDEIAEHQPRQADITAVLGLNFNLHPRLSPLEVVYPRATPMPGATGVLTLGDLAVRADPAGRRLQLVSTVDGQPIDLVPMNFLYPAAAPRLYRFLCAFGPTRTYRGGLWDRVWRPGDPAAPPVLPRVVLGDLVLDRRTWRTPVAALPDLAGVERQELAALAGLDRWRTDTGLPRSCFFRVFGPPADPGATTDWVEQSRRWALEARSARLRKPHFLDFHNPFLTHVLARQARSVPDGTVTVQECLPAAESYGTAGRPDSAEEFLVEAWA
ncbi:MAG TPA: lantibiotic dehydratase [Pseudonocardiaceae bacterium]|nr:lantibiotic dehydratase [Pseudonocardiaceae bacterium]